MKQLPIISAALTTLLTVSCGQKAEENNQAQMLDTTDVVTMSRE